MKGVFTYKIAFIFTVIGLATLPLLSPTTVHAQSFNPGRIIDDGVFTNKYSMDPSQIQQFLNSKVPVCDTNGTQPSEYGGGTRAQWAQAKYGQGTFTCLKNYSENGKSAAQIIYDVAQEFTINPQVLIVLLQKEQGLVTDTWPLNIQYRTATGYGCPDTAPCDSQYYGLTNQLRWAGRMFRAILNKSPTWNTPYVLGNNRVYWHPDLGRCGSQNLSIENLSTAALYNYTPYRPNQAALNAGYGTGDSCSSYGNRNFFLYFRDWFGNTYGGPAYQWSVNSFQIYRDAARTQPIAGNKISLQPDETAYATIIAINNGNNVWDSNTILSTTNPAVVTNTDWIAYNRIARLNSYPVSYGQTGTFNFSFKAPSQAGYYYQSININHNSNIWLNDPGIGIAVEVASPLPAPTSNEASSLKSGATMLPGQKIYSPYSRSVLVFENGNVSLYVDTRLVWRAGTPGSQATRLVNQTDGNIVLYDKDNKALWASNTDGKGASDLFLQLDGNAVLYNRSGATWASGTATQSELYSANYTMAEEGVLFQEQSLTTVDRKYRLILQSDGNLVLYSPSGPIWASNTDNKGGYKLAMQKDGNLVLYTKDNKAIWATHKDGYGTSSLYLQADHNIVTYNRSGATWASGTAGR